MASPLIATNIVDKNGKATTVYKKADEGAVDARSVGSIPPAPQAHSAVQLPAGLSADDVSNVMSAYFVAAVWSSTGTNEEDESDVYELDSKGYSSDDFNEDALEESEAAFLKFAASNSELIKDALGRGDYDASQLGHDLWLTRNHHGAGFWDREQLKEGGLGDKLTTASESLGETNVWENGDGTLSIS